MKQIMQKNFILLIDYKKNVKVKLLIYYLFKLTGGYTTHEDGVRKFHNKDDKKGFEVGAMTVAIVRGSVTRKDSWMDFVSILERSNATLVNPRTTINICADKYRTALRLADYGLTQPKTKLINDF